MASTYIDDNFLFGQLSRPSTTVGSILSHDGTDKFELNAPTMNTEVLVSNNAQSSGTQWVASTAASGFAFSTPNIGLSAFVSTTGTPFTQFFMVDTTTTNSTVPLGLPNCEAIYLSLQISNNGWCNDPTRFIAGNMQFSIGRVPANTQVIPANFTPYAGAPHLTVNFSDINTVPNRYRSFATMLNVPVTNGDLVSVRIVSTLQRSGGAPPTFGQFTPFLFFRGTI